MFANLKNKIIEEGTSKFQQFANAAQAAVSSSPNTPSGSESNVTATTSNENFFSITEEDTPQNSPYKPLKLPPGVGRGRATTPLALNNGTGAVPRTRRLSNSSMASDVSFRLPSYDSPAVYHLQSDWDASGSEMGELDDTASTAKLDVITKEQLYDAYKKSLDRYHKYRCRYTDLAKKYKDLERDSTKARSVLVETQEKAIRRISELREQCTLEQQAKAHLEEQLRMEMDDMQCQMQAYQTKLKLLGESPENITAALEQTNEQLIDLSVNNNQAESAVTNGDATENLIGLESETEGKVAFDAKIVELEKLLKEREQELLELNDKFNASTATIESLKKQEEENALLLAQTKQAIHSELENKESEVKQLKNNIKQIQNDLKAASKKETQLNGQIEEMKDLKEKIKQINAAKQESEAKLIAAEHTLSQLKLEFSAKTETLNTTEEKLSALTKESEQKLQDLRQQNTQLNEMVQRYQQNEVSLAEIDNELNRTKNENDNLRATIAANEQRIQTLETELAQQQSALKLATYERHTIEKSANDEKQRAEQLTEQLAQINIVVEEHVEKVKQMEAEIRILNEQSTHNENEAIVALRAELQSCNAEHASQLQALREQLNAKEKELKACNNKLSKQKTKHDAQLTKIAEQSEELEKLRAELNRHEAHLETLQNEAQEREQRGEAEKYELKTQVTQILQEIAQMEEQMSIVQRSHADLETEKCTLEARIEQMQKQQSQEADAGWKQAEEQRKILETKLQTVESENSQLAERNCLLEENVNRIEKQMIERERNLNAEVANTSEMRLKLETAEDAITKLNEKMLQVLDENSQMQNAQELMDHDHRTLQDKCDALEKEKLLAEDAQKCLDNELTELKESKATLEVELQRMEQKYNETNAHGILLSEALKQAESKTQTLNSELLELRSHAQSDDEKLQATLQQSQHRINELQTALSETESNAAEARNQLSIAAESAEALERAKEELVLLRAQNESLNQEVAQLQSTSGQLQTEAVQRLQTQLEQLQLAHQEQIITLEASETQLRANADEAQEKVQQANADVERLHESNDALQVQMDQLKSNNELQLQEMQQKLQQLQSDYEKLLAQHKATAQHASMLANYEQVQIENEFLQTQVHQMEEQTSTFKADADAHIKETAELREKLKSLQCELYVLQENAEAHNTLQQAKEQELQRQTEELQTLKETLANERIELTRQSDHSKYIAEQHDAVQKELLAAQQQLAELQSKLTQAQTTLSDSAHAVSTSEAELEKLRAENTDQRDIIMRLENDLKALQIELAERLQLQNISTTTEQSVTNTNSKTADAQHLRDLNSTLQRELEDLKHKSSSEISSLQQEIEDLQNNSKHMMERMMEMESIRAGLQAQKLFVNATTTTTESSPSPTGEEVGLQSEKDELEAKLKLIMSEVQDVSNRNLFLEQKCENYLILEQSNERLKLQNSKLSRQLDETLVSMQHNEGITANTEFEYLKNIMFQYLTGSANGNNETLVKVISAVLKFSPQQTQVALEKEHQRRSLINKIL